MRTLATFLVQLAMAAEHGPRTRSTRPAPERTPIIRFHLLATGTYVEETI